MVTEDKGLACRVPGASKINSKQIPYFGRVEMILWMEKPGFPLAALVRIHNFLVLNQLSCAEGK